MLNGICDINNKILEGEIRDKAYFMMASEQNGKDAAAEEHCMAQQKKQTGSIDVTKALVLLGFSSWRHLEPGKHALGVVN